jgi:hypothetical protein
MTGIIRDCREAAFLAEGFTGSLDFAVISDALVDNGLEDDFEGAGGFLVDLTGRDEFDFIDVDFDDRGEKRSNSSFLISANSAAIFRISAEYPGPLLPMTSVSGAPFRTSLPPRLNDGRYDCLG